MTHVLPEFVMFTVTTPFLASLPKLSISFSVWTAFVVLELRSATSGLWGKVGWLAGTNAGCVIVAGSQGVLVSS